MRVRSRGSSYTENGVFYTGSRRTKDPDGWPSANQSRSLTISRSSLETTSDTVTPGYFAKVKKGQVLPVNPFSTSKWEVMTDKLFVNAGVRGPKDILGYHSFVTYDYNGPFTSSLPSDSFLPPATSQFNTVAMGQQALEKARSRAWDAMTTVAELGKTQSLLVQALSSLRRRTELILDAMGRRSRRRRPTYGELLSEFSSMWLEARYGWRLLYFDIVAVQEAVGSLGDVNDIVRYTVTQDRELDTVFTPWYNPAGHLFTRWKVEGRSKCRVGTLLEVELNADIQFDPLVTVYELIPFSFVVDWFLTTGSIVQAFSPFGRPKSQQAFVSYETEYTLTGEARLEDVSFNGVPQSYSWKTVLCDASVTRVLKTRDPTGISPIPQFRLRLGAFEAVDLAAIAFGILYRKKRALLRMLGRPSR